MNATATQKEVPLSNAVRRIDRNRRCSASLALGRGAISLIRYSFSIAAGAAAVGTQALQTGSRFLKQGLAFLKPWNLVRQIAGSRVAADVRATASLLETEATQHPGDAFSR